MLSYQAKLFFISKKTYDITVLQTDHKPQGTKPGGYAFLQILPIGQLAMVFLNQSK
jgi:hypothetical protein